MTSEHIRKQLNRLIDSLPDDLLEEIAGFTLFIMARRGIVLEYEDWESKQWQDFSLGQFFREDDEVGYFLEDAEEVYRP